MLASRDAEEGALEGSAPARRPLPRRCLWVARDSHPALPLKRREHRSNACNPWTRRRESKPTVGPRRERLLCRQPRPGRGSVRWRFQRESNPCSRIDNPASWPLDDGTMWWSHAESNRSRLSARRASFHWTMAPKKVAAGRWLPTVWIRSVARGPDARSRSAQGTTRLETD